MKGLQRLWYIFEKIKDNPQENALGEEFKLEFSAKFWFMAKWNVISVVKSLKFFSFAYRTKIST